jgi:hypothetical protein
MEVGIPNDIPDIFKADPAGSALMLFLRKEAFLDELFSDLDCVGGGTLAEVVCHAPEVEAGLD